MYKKEKWSNQTILAVWQKGRSINGYDSSKYRKDACGAVIEFSKHGDRDADRGWEIDHIRPESQGGSDELYNLQPLHWKNNLEKGDSSQLRCAITS